MDNLTRWASPPLRVVAGWPSRMYPRPTSRMVESLLLTLGMAEKKSDASATVMLRTSAMDLPLKRTSSASRL